MKTISTFKFQPWLAEKMRIHDTCGVHNLHGMPAVMGALLSCILAALATEKEYGGKNAYVSRTS